jgi:hypothetical protein
MNTKKKKKDEILAVARQTAHYSDLLAKQCSRWTPPVSDETFSHPVKKETKVKKKLRIEN